MSTLKDIFVGLAIFGDTINLKDPTTATMVLVGHHDDVLLKTFFWVANKREPKEEEYKTDEHSVRMLKSAKDRIRDDIQYVIRMAELEEQQAKAKEFETLKRTLRNSNKPHELGTVAEISARYGISKSEVRRRKAEGNLGEWLLARELTKTA